MRILITGAGGMLAQALAQEFLKSDEERDDVLMLASYESVDITNKASIEVAVSEFKPDVIINAAAYTDVDKAEEEEETAALINGEGVRNLAEVAKGVGAKLIHYSTDYIFAGDREEGYDESFSGYSPVNAYGRSKLLGEQAIGEVGGDTFIIRTSWLYGSGGRNFVDTMVRLMGERDELNVINDQFGYPTYTVDLASATRELLYGDYEPGFYHITNSVPSGKMSWFDFATAISEIIGADTKVNPIPASEYITPAKRPMYSMLLNTKFPPRRDWKEALSEYLSRKISE